MSNLSEENKPEIKSKLEEIFSSQNVNDKKHNLVAMSYDATELDPHLPDFICLVENVDQIVEVVKYANEKKIPLVPYISGNNVGGLTIPEKGGIILDFGKKMNKILHVHENHMYALLEPGVTFGQLNKYLKDHHPNLRYSYPFAPPYAGVVGNAILSGMNNMSTMLGSMGDSINGLEVVTHDGSVTRIGTCWSKEFRVDNWHSRYPMPDLMGLFINWQGMTGIITKCAVQLWPKKPIQKGLLAILKDPDATAEFLRESGRLGIIDDNSAVSVEAAKMSLNVPEPESYENEPEYCMTIALSGQNQKHYNIKCELIQNLADKLNNIDKYRNKIQLVDFNHFAAVIGDGCRVFFDLPSVVTPLVEYSGLTWVGTYAPPENLEILMTEGKKIFKKYNIPPFIYMKSMKYSHYALFRTIVRFKKSPSENSRMRLLCTELLDLSLKYGCIPYKTPIWMCNHMKENIIDPNWLKLLKETKKFMDPNGIFNPGRWGI